VSIIFALLSLSIIIVVHELGHFIAARSAGIPVHEFSIGMGKSLFSKKFGDTEFSLRLLPLGGYVRVAGMDSVNDNSSDIEISFLNKLKILFAGSFYNFLFAWVVFLMITFFMGVPSVSTNIIDYVYQGSPAQQSGVLKGDQVLSINDYSVSNGSELANLISSAGTDALVLVLRRGEMKRTVTVTPEQDNGRYVIGVRFLLGRNGAFSIVKSLEVATLQSAQLVKSIFQGLSLLITREVSLDQVYGPVGIISLTGQAASFGFVYFFGFLALLSINLAVINLLPIPALDGGRIFIAILDKILGEKMSRSIESRIHLAGFFILILFVIYISYFDIQKILLK